MNPDRMDEMARDPRFIPGIYNYCDQWCQRCGLTSRCMNYALALEEDVGGCESRDVENEAFWDKLHETFDATIGGLEEAAEAMDLDIDEEGFDESLDEQEEIRETVHSQPFSRTAMRYIEVSEQWLRSHEDLAANGPADMRDCLEVVRWYQHQIWVKLSRAADGAIRARIDDTEGSGEDADGSAKVAILGIERSLAAWATLLNRFPDHEDAIFAMGTLRRLLRQVEVAFPHARSFRRPGFDTEEA